MATAKTATLVFRSEVGPNEALRTVAEREHRSIANMVDVLIRNYSEKRYCDPQALLLERRAANRDQGVLLKPCGLTADFKLTGSHNV